MRDHLWAMLLHRNAWAILVVGLGTVIKVWNVYKRLSSSLKWLIFKYYRTIRPAIAYYNSNACLNTILHCQHACSRWKGLTTFKSNCPNRLFHSFWLPSAAWHRLPLLRMQLRLLSAILKNWKTFGEFLILEKLQIWLNERRGIRRDCSAVMGLCKSKM